MGNLQKSEAQQLRETQLKESLGIGMIFLNRRGEEIIRIKEIFDQQFNEKAPIIKKYRYDRIDNFVERTWTNYGCSDFSELYRSYCIESPIQDLDKLIEEANHILIHGVTDDIHDDDEGTEMSSEIVAMNSKENLLAMKDSIDLVIQKKDQLNRMVNFLLEQKKAEFDLVRRKLQDQVRILQKKVEKIMKVVTVIELYLGIEEELVQLKSGEPAPIDEPLSLRQKILFMDEEVSVLTDQGIDYNDVDKFDEWLMEEDRYNIILPEKKSIVVFKPRRSGKIYYDAYDRRREEIDPKNKQPYFLIRNGENIYRISSGRLTLPERLFPKRSEFKDILEKMSMDDGQLQSWDKEKIEDITYLYQRIVFFIQGLLDRTQIFQPIKKVNLMKMEEQDAAIRLIYDDELCMPTGRLTFSQWQEQLNSTIEVGSRIVWASHVQEGSYYQGSYSGRRFLRYYGKYNIPTYPDEGVYVVEECIEKKRYWEQEGKKYKEIKHTCIKYNPGGGYWTWNGYFDRKNNISFLIDPKKERQILNYDGIDINDVDFYINDRTDRSNYLGFLPILKTIKKHLLEEQEQEDHFCLMLIGECQKRNLAPKKGLTYEDIIMELINWWKYKNKWKRPISKNDESAMKMIERRLFAVSNKRKWFK